MAVTSYFFLSWRTSEASGSSAANLIGDPIYAYEGSLKDITEISVSESSAAEGDDIIVTSSGKSVSVTTALTVPTGYIGQQIYIVLFRTTKKLIHTEA